MMRRVTRIADKMGIKSLDDDALGEIVVAATNAANAEIEMRLDMGEEKDPKPSNAEIRRDQDWREKYEDPFDYLRRA
jgi:hypothetical protein